MRRIPKRIAVCALLLPFVACTPKTAFPTVEPAVPSPAVYHPPTALPVPSLSFPYVNSFEGIAGPDDLTAAGISASFNQLEIADLEVHSGSRAVEAAGTLGGADHPELHIQFDVPRFLGVPSLDLSDKTVAFFVFVPADSQIRTAGFTAFKGGQFVAIGSDNVVPGGWNAVILDVPAIDASQAWDAVSDGITRERAEEIISTCETFEINAMQSAEGSPKDTRFVLDDLSIQSSSFSALATDDSVESLRLYANRLGKFIGTSLTDPPGLEDPEYLRILVQEFNMMLTSHGPWAELQPDPGENGFNFTQDERFVHFGTSHHLAVRGPCLGWHNLLPDWLLQSDFETLDGILTTYIDTVMRRYAGDILIWDAFNEVINDAGNGFRNRDSVATWKDFYNLANSVWVRGGDTALIEKAFTEARSVCKECTLILNEFGNEEAGTNHGNTEYNARKADFFYEFVRGWLKRENPIPIDGVGFQLHLDESRIVDLDLFEQNVDRNVKRFAALGLEVQFTELDVRIHVDDINLNNAAGKKTLTDRLEHQAEIYRRLMRIALRNDNVTVILLFGLSDRYSPIEGTNPGTGYAHIFDKDYKPKPAYYAILEELKAAG